MFWLIVFSPLISCLILAILYLQDEKIKIAETWKRGTQIEINEQQFFRQ